MISDASLTPELIEARAFTTGFRGYDQGEVRSYLKRLAAEIQDLRERARQLESAWRSAEERAARPPVLDEDTLMAAVGEETASILRSARAAAADLRSRAADDAEKAIAEARAEAERILQEAKDVMGRETQAAEEAANRILNGARSEAAEAVEKAQREAEVIRAKAEQERTLTVEGANATRERILDDLSRRRRVATVQIEQLRAGRERLIESYAVVRRTLEEAQHELSRADAEARTAAEEVGRRLRAEEPAGSVLPEAAASSTTAVSEPSAPEESPPSEPSGSSPPGPESHPHAETAAGDPVESAEAPVEASESPARRGGRRRPFGRRNGTGNGNGTTAPVAASAPTEVDDGADAGVAAARAEPGEVGAPADDASPAATDAETAAETPAATAAATASAGPAGDSTPVAAEEAAAPGSAVDELFAKLRSAQEEAPEEKAEEAATEEKTADADEALLQKREAVIVDLEVTLTRKLKRALQDEQNDLLDRLRGIRGQVTATRLLPEVGIQIKRYADTARPAAEEAAHAGARFANETSGRKPRSKGEGPDIGDLVDEAGHNIVEPLRRRLEQAVSASADEEQSVLVESLGAAYREWKSQRIERVAGDLLAAAFARGTWHAIPAGTTVRWIVEDADGPCPDCDDDALAGSLPKEEAFPTGQHHPPAHSGCRCLLVPSA